MDVGITLPGFGSDAVEHAQHAEGPGVGVALGDVPPSLVEHRVRSMTGYGLSEEQAREVVVSGSVARARDRFGRPAEAGADRIVAMPFTEDRFRQAELVARAASTG